LKDLPIFVCSTATNKEHKINNGKKGKTNPQFFTYQNLQALAGELISALC
jgi:hypothetical protein